MILISENVQNAETTGGIANMVPKWVGGWTKNGQIGGLFRISKDSSFDILRFPLDLNMWTNRDFSLDVAEK